MRQSRLVIPFEIKEVSDDGEVAGYGAAFGNVDLGWDRIEQGAFKESINQLKNGDPLPMLWQHDSAEPIGVWHGFSEDRKGLFVEGQLNLSMDSGQADVPAAWKARALAKQKAVKGLSIGYEAIDYKYEDDVRVLEKLNLREVSFATFPMNPVAQLTAVKNISNKDFVQIVREALGLSREAAEALRADGLSGLRRVTGSAKGSEVQEGLAKLLQTIKGK